MVDTATALYDFWSSFGIPAFVEGYIPDDVVNNPPYITYRLAKPDWRYQISTYARVWYMDTSYRSISQKLDEIGNAIGEGLMLPCGDNGSILLFKDVNFIQFEQYEDERYKVAYLQLIMEVNE